MKQAMHIAAVNSLPEKKNDLSASEWNHESAGVPVGDKKGLRKISRYLSIGPLPPGQPLVFFTFSVVWYRKGDLLLVPFLPFSHPCSRGKHV